VELTQIIYTSTLKSTDPQVMNDILGCSRRNNLRDAITGVLFQSGQRLVHVLEGPSLSLERTFARIASDTRHIHLTFIGRKTIAKREFLAWDLGYALITAESADESFSKHALFKVGAHLVDDRASHAIACEVLKSLKPEPQAVT
jgi:hypothetical protein